MTLLHEGSLATLSGLGILRSECARDTSTIASLKGGREKMWLAPRPKLADQVDQKRGEEPLSFTVVLTWGAGHFSYFDHRRVTKLDGLGGTGRHLPAHRGDGAVRRPVPQAPHDRAPAKALPPPPTACWPSPSTTFTPTLGAPTAPGVNELVRLGARDLAPGGVPLARPAADCRRRPRRLVEEARSCQPRSGPARLGPRRQRDPGRAAPAVHGAHRWRREFYQLG